KYANPRHIAKHEKNLKRKQQKLSRKVKGSKSREKARKLVARVHERVRNSRQDFLHKLSRKLVDENQVIVVENLNVKGMVKKRCDPGESNSPRERAPRNHCLAKAISDVGWGTFINFLDYKLVKEGKVLIEIDRWFPSSKTCSECNYKMDKMPLDVREWTCPKCGTTHDRDENASKTIRAEGIRQIQALGISASAGGGDVRLVINNVDEKQFPVNPEATHLSVG
ncbi:MULTISPECIES: RNA-guided endonuclease TnpB family protein, partial [Spirulina sp. CCY15215]|uniref:RNA-guided endonuclease InsQ/TnpB family protein n=1 Tax=Spirulina sp. CCY15215 TaxID=2767591 RepID=UPI00194DD698